MRVSSKNAPKLRCLRPYVVHSEQTSALTHATLPPLPSTIAGPRSTSTRKGHLCACTSTRAPSGSTGRSSTSARSMCALSPCPTGVRFVRMNPTFTLPSPLPFAPSPHPFPSPKSDSNARSPSRSTYSSTSARDVTASSAGSTSGKWTSLRTPNSRT